MSTTKYDLNSTYMSYDVPTRTHRVDVHLNGRKYFFAISDHRLSELRAEKSEEEKKLAKELEQLKKSMTDTVNQITTAFEEKLKNEQRLRADAEKLNEHLHDQVSIFRREFQGGHVSDRLDPNTGSGYFFKGEGGSFESKVPTSRANPSKHRVNAEDNSV